MSSEFIMGQGFTLSYACNGFDLVFSVLKLYL